VARYRIAPSARADLAQTLATSIDRWGKEGKQRYATLIAAGFRKVAGDPDGYVTKARDDLSHDIRSLHLRNITTVSEGARVKRPVHLLYYRVVQPGLVEIVRILHERMEPERHIGTDLKS
jgi:toxin ParE1/3/4